MKLVDGNLNANCYQTTIEKLRHLKRMKNIIHWKDKLTISIHVPYSIQ